MKREKAMSSCPRFIMQISKSDLCTRVTWPINSRNILNTLWPGHGSCQHVEGLEVSFQWGTYLGTWYCDTTAPTYNVTILDVTASTSCRREAKQKIVTFSNIQQNCKFSACPFVFLIVFSAVCLDVCMLELNSCSTRFNKIRCQFCPPLPPPPRRSCKIRNY